MKKPKTNGIEWLYLSMSSFNGSGYANKTSPESYATSYVYYKYWKKLPEHAQVALDNWNDALVFGGILCDARDGREPTEKYMNKFISYCESQEALNINIPQLNYY